MFKRYIKYRIDRIFSKGLTYQLIVLIFTIIIILLVVSVFMKLVFDYPIAKAFWDSLMQFIDTGNISAVEANLGIVITFLTVTFVGVCGWGLLIAMINNSLQDKIQNLSKGNAFIIEKNHSIILGYGEEALTIIEEFIDGRAKKIVLLSKTDTDSIKKRISFLNKKRKVDIIVRQGNPNIIENLKLLNIEKSNSISVINDNDADSIKILLSLRMIANKCSEVKNSNSMNICVLVNDKNSIELIKSIEEKEKFIIHIVYKYEILYKLIAQSIIYTGLSSVYEELFSYQGPDIKIEYKHNHINYEFKKVASKYLSNSADSKLLLGVIGKDKNLCIPDSKYVIKEEDKLVILYTNYTEDGDKEVSKHTLEESLLINNVLLICNENQNNELMETIIKEYNESSKIIRMNYNEIDKVDNKSDFISNKLKSEAITKIILISEDIEIDIKAINILLIIRQVIKKENHHIPVLSLINSIENRDLIRSDDIRDFIVSGNLIGMLMAHAAFNPDMLYLFNGLLSKNGKDIIIKKYESLNNISKIFKDIYLDALNRKEIVIGYKRDNIIKLNPNPEDTLEIKDEIIVITDNYYKTNHNN